MHACIHEKEENMYLWRIQEYSDGGGSCMYMYSYCVKTELLRLQEGGTFL